MIHDPPWPLLVHIGKNNTASALMNRKAYRKSIEASHPWVVHPATGRVLPWPGEPDILSLTEAPGCFILQIPSDSLRHPYGSSTPDSVDPDSRKILSKTPEAHDHTVLNMLTAIIADRGKGKPEGSYTSHLLAEGPEKIRKKLGEEAVELILARKDSDVIYESADLVYHLLVLLESLNLSWQNVVSELRRRQDS